MPIVITAVAVVGALCLLDLLLTFAVIRRLREHAAMLADNRGQGLAGPPVIGLSPGEAPGAFSAVTLDGRRVDENTALQVVAFFSTACSICPERVPPLLEYLAANNVDRASVLAVIVGHDGKPAAYQAALAEFAQICIEPEDGEVATAFQVAGYPAFSVRGADGTIVASGYDPASLPEPALV